MGRWAIAALVGMGLLGEARAQGVEVQQRPEQLVSARTLGSRVFVDPEGATLPGIGQATLIAVERFRRADLVYGDRGSLLLSVSHGEEDWQLELLSAGFPPAAALGLEEAPERIPGDLAGGVRLGLEVFGATGIGPGRPPPTPAAVSVFGLATVWRNGERIAEAVPVEAHALPRGILDSTGSPRLTPTTDLLGPELHVLVHGLGQTDVGEPLWFAFPGVQISGAGGAVVSGVEPTAPTDLDQGPLPGVGQGGLPVAAPPGAGPSFSDFTGVGAFPTTSAPAREVEVAPPTGPLFDTQAQQTPTPDPFQESAPINLGPGFGPEGPLAVEARQPTLEPPLAAAPGTREAPLAEQGPGSGPFAEDGEPAPPGGMGATPPRQPGAPAVGTPGAPTAGTPGAPPAGTPGAPPPLFAGPGATGAGFTGPELGFPAQQEVYGEMRFQTPERLDPSGLPVSRETTPGTPASPQVLNDGRGAQPLIPAGSVPPGIAPPPPLTQTPQPLNAQPAGATGLPPGTSAPPAVPLPAPATPPAP